jgi:hypothetical protein
LPQIGVADDQNISNHIRIFPNPLKDYIHANFNSWMTGRKTMSFYDLQGRKLQEIETDEPDLEILLPKIRGLIIFEVKWKDETFIKKLIRE